MKLSFHKGDLLDAIQVVQSSISTKSTLPILSNFLIHAIKSSKSQNISVRIEATDLEVGVRCSVKAEVLEEGRITLPAKKLSELAREMPDGKEIEISSGEGRRVELKCGKIKASLLSLPAEDFPIIPAFPDNKSFKLKRSMFQDMVRKTYFAASSDETRYILNGIYFAVAGGELKMVATDGRRLAYISKNGADKELTASVIIPSRAIGELLRLIPNESGEKEDWVFIAPYENQISFRWAQDGNEITLVSRIIDGTFPNYDQVIPKSKEIDLKIKSSEIYSAVKRAALFAQDRGGSVRFSLKKKLLKISANAQSVGEEEEELEVNYEGPDFEIAFNPMFLLDVLKNSDAKEVQFEFSSSLNPGLIKPGANGSYLCVIMPMRLQ